ncbi:putative 1,2-phenylacetyl-CoA epoxidase, subunit D [compost metagenome]
MTPKETIEETLRTVYDPELGVNVLDLGLIYELNQDDAGVVHVQMTLTTQGCPLHDTIVGGVRNAVSRLPGVTGVDVDLVWSPAWTPDKMKPEAKLQLGF